MNAFVSIVKPATIVICSQDAEYAADFIELKDILNICERLNAILTAASTFVYKITEPQDELLVKWAAKSSGNFVWLATFAQHLHLRNLIETGKSLPSVEALTAIVTFGFDHIPIGEFSEIPNTAFSPTYELDFRNVRNPYFANQLMLKALTDLRR